MPEPTVFRLISHYRVIYNSRTHLMKSVLLSGGKDCNLQPTDGKRNYPSLSLSLLAGIISVLYVRPL